MEQRPPSEPADYRVAWTPADEDYLPYSADNTTKRGNSYPGGDATTLTLTGLPGGVNYRVMMRARYHDEQTDEYTSGPWTAEATQRVQNTPPAAPTINTRDEPQQEDDEEPLIAQQQQGSPVLVSNLSNAGDSVSAIDNLSSGNQIRLEQSFRTGRHSGGYSVTEIQAFIASITGSVGPWVRIHADNNNKPGTRLRSFTEVTGLANNSTASFTSSEGAITLNPNTKYWLVFGMTSADNSHRYRINNSNGNIDSCGELDWNIYDESLGAQYDTSDVRQRDHTDDPIMVAIIGSQVDNGSASELECEDTSATTTEDITLVSNLETAEPSGANSSRLGGGGTNLDAAGTSITTGGHGAGYTVNTVQLSVHAPLNRTGLAPKLYIHADNNGAPGAKLHDLTTPTNSVMGDADTKIEFTGSGITLSPSTKYWMMFAEETTSTIWYHANSNSISIDQGSFCGEPGFTINNDRYEKVGTTLSENTNGPLSFAVVGSPVGGTTVTCQTPGKISVDTYTKIGMGSTAIGAFQSDRDADWFAVTLEEDVDYQFDMFTGINGGGDTTSEAMDLAVYNDDGTGDGEVQTINLMEVDPSIGRGVPITTPDAKEIVYWEKRRAYFKPTVAGKYYLKATLKGSTYQNPTYTVRVRKADDYADDINTPGEVTVGGSVRGHFFTDHGDGADTDWISVSLTSGQTYNLTLTGHATANTQMKILEVYESDGTTKVHDGASAGKYSSTVSVQFTPDATETHYVVLSSEQHVRMCQKYTYDGDGAVDGLEGDPFECAVQARHPAPDYTFTVVED